MEMSMQDPLVVVTGGSSGIGRSTVDLILSDWQTAHVVILDKNTDGIERTKNSRLLTIDTDVSDARSVGMAFNSATTWASQSVTHLVNCAGNQVKAASLELTSDKWHSVLSVHLDGTFYACQAAAKQMCEAGGGVIVNFSSVAEVFGWAARLPYAVAKAGISALTRTLSVEWAEYGIRVNAVAPGYVETPMIVRATSSGGIVEDPAPLHALGRLAQPHEIAEAVIWLLSPKSSFVTGETLFVDGGFRQKKVRW